MKYSPKMFTTIIAVFTSIIILRTDCLAQQFGIGSSPSQQTANQGVLISTGGRFVFGQISDSEKDKFMLDTWTGRLWRIGESGGIGLYLSAVPYRDENGKTSPLPEKIPGEKNQKPERR